MLQRIRTLLWVLLAAVVAVGCGGQGGQEGDGDDSSLQAVATFSILGDMVENVAGEDVELSTMVGPGEDTHTFEASPSDVRALTESDLVFENGLEFEGWLDELYESSGSAARRVVVSESIEPIEAGGHDSHDHGEHEGHDHDEETHGEHEGQGTHEHEEEGHDHGEYDPHVWQNPNSAVVIVETVRDNLIEANPGNEDAYQQNAEEYIGQLEELDTEVRDQVESIPEENRKLVTGHQVFSYFAAEYGFEVPGTAISSATTETADPSAGEIADLSDQIREENVPAIFPEIFTTDERVMERLATEAGVELAPPLFTGSLAEEGEEGDTYLGMMRYNAETMAAVLGER